jgi:opacity protein-like surface antigen
MNKYKTLSTAALLAAMASVAQAGGTVEPQIEQQVDGPVVQVVEPVTQMHNWTGAYGGLMFGQSSGDFTATPSQSSPATGDIDSGNRYGAFVGYNMQRGNLVYGAELGLSKPDFNVSVAPSVAIDSTMIDVKGRLGFAMDRAMVYGTIGYMSSGFTDTNDSTKTDLNGMTYGLGIDYMVTQSVFVGLEYQRANLSGSQSGYAVDANLDTIALRLGYQF